METIAFMGPYDAAVKKIMRKMVSKDFRFIEVTDMKDTDQLKEAHYIILRVLRMEGGLIRELPLLKLIQRWGVGFDKVDIAAAGERNIPVAVTPGMNAASVAEMAVLHMLAVYRKLLVLHGNVVNGKWQRPGIASHSYTICGKKVGLIGLGNIGELVAKQVQAFGAEVQYYDMFRLQPVEELRLGIQYVSLEELLKNSDIVSLHIPLTDSTRHLLNKDTFRLMKKNAILINTARGGIIQESDLIEALSSHKIMGAGLDCLETEPVSTDNPLLKLDNVVLTPHMGGSTMDTSVNMARHCIENIVKVSQGKPLPTRDIVNAKYLRG
ncbi:MAG: 2-hydroxyacid dehydrogenase [Veillonellales bacterium]